MKIYIPTLGRWGAKTAFKREAPSFRLFPKHEPPENIVAVVEPHEATQYRSALDSIGLTGSQVLTLPHSGRGLAFARNWILNHAYQQGEEWFVMADDDIFHFASMKPPRKTSMSSWAPLRGAMQHVIDQSRTAQPGSFDYATLCMVAGVYRANLNAKEGEDPFVRPFGFMDVCVAYNAPLLKNSGMTWKDEFLLKLDRAFALECICSGLQTAMILNHGFSPRPMGEFRGGLSEHYANKSMVEEGCLAMVKAWPGIVSLIEKKGAMDIWIDIRTIRDLAKQV